MNILMILLLALFPGCTVSVTCVHGEGSSKDDVEESQAPSTSACPVFSIPFKAV